MKFVSKLRIFTFLLISMAAFSDGEPMGAAQYLDEFGDDVGIVHEDGKFRFYCPHNVTVCANDANGTFHFTANGETTTTLHTMTCQSLEKYRNKGGFLFEGRVAEFLNASWYSFDTLFSCTPYANFTKIRKCLNTSTDCGDPYALGVFRMDYALCRDNDPKCVNETASCDGNDEEKVCVLVGNQLKDRVNPYCQTASTRFICSRTHVTSNQPFIFCPFFAPGKKFGFCEAVRGSYRSTWTKLSGKGSCKAYAGEHEGAAYIIFKTANKKFLYGEPIHYSSHVQTSKSLDIHCPHSIVPLGRENISIECWFKALNQTIIGGYKTSCYDEKLSIPPFGDPKASSLLSNGSRILKMNCNYTDEARTFTGELSHKVVIFDSSATVTRFNKTNGKFDYAECKLDREPKDGISVEYSWKDADIPGDVVERGSKLSIKEPGDYRCWIHFSYTACSFHKLLQEVVPCPQNLTISDEDGDLTPTAKTPIASSYDQKPTASTETTLGSLEIGLIVGGLLLVAIIGVVGVIVILRRRRRSQMVPKAAGGATAFETSLSSGSGSGSNSMQPYDPLHELILDEKNALDFAALKKEATRIIAMRPADVNTGQRSISTRSSSDDQATIDEYLKNLVDESEEKLVEKKGVVAIVPGCRAQHLANRKDTQLLIREKREKRKQKSVRLHITKLYDYYGDTLLLCQAPLPTQFVAHWKAIWQEKVGVIIWVGELREITRTKIDPYISLEESGIVRYEEYTITTMLYVHIPDEYDAYWVTVNLKGQKRELIVVHVHMWPDHSIPEEPAKLADLLSIIDQHHLNQSKAGLPGVMAHCSLGVQRSPALIAVYIGRQMWLRERMVNIVGIIKYIRHHRWLSFEYGEPFAQIKVVYGVLEVIATRKYTEGLKALKVGVSERDIFNVNERRADMKRLRIMARRKS